MRAVAAVLLLLGAGCGGGDDEKVAGTTPGPETAPAATAAAAGCVAGKHSVTLENGGTALLRIGPGSGETRPAVLVALHGAGQSPADALEAFRGAWDERGLVVVAPQSKGETWSILRQELDEDLESVNGALAAVYERCDVDHTRVFVGGFSDGATYALTLAVANGDLFPAVIAFSPGGVDGGQPVGKTRVFVSHGTLDPILPIETTGDAVVRRLREAGYRVTYHRFEGGHSVYPENSERAIRWLLDG